VLSHSRRTPAVTLRGRARDEVPYPTLSDAVLVVRARDGDREALGALVERHAPAVRRLAAFALADPQDAEDAAQEALAKLCIRIGQFRGEARFTTWLYSLVANTCRDLGERQRRRHHQPLEAAAEPGGHDEPQDLALQRDLRRALAAHLAGLSADQRQVMVMKDVLGLSYEEIGAALDMPVGTVKCHAHRGRARLRHTMTRGGGEAVPA
jgi:RNA polymerase sigma-70 factor (ECF subfamily)